jgi:hypothetical protein
MNRNVLLGCAVVFVALVVVLVIAAFVLVPHTVSEAKKWFGAQMEEANRRAEIEKAWRPPSATLDTSWFPAAVGAWTLTANEETPGLPELNVDRAGRRGKYRGPKQDIEVTILPVNDLEKDAIFSRAKSALESSNSQVTTGTNGPVSYRVESRGSHVTTQTPGRLYVRTDGKHHTRLWWMKDFLFIFRTDGPDDPDAFAEQFLSAMTPPELEAR